MTSDETRGRRAAPRRRPRWWVLALAGALLAVSTAGWLAYRKLNGNITTDLTAAEQLARYDAERPPPAPGRARNILLIGTDSRAGPNGGGYGEDDGTQRSDTVILVHLAGDRDRATALSLPRDLLVDIPQCTGRDGETVPARHGQFNTAFETGGAGCTIRAVERLTGIRIDHHLVVDFTGFRDLVDAAGGVELCLDRPLSDEDSGLELPAGCRRLDGEEALSYVRARKGLGDGSDTARIDRQQRLMAALTDQLYASGVLLNPVRLYPVLDEATSALTVDAGLDSLTELYDLVRQLREVPEDRIGFATVPRESAPDDANRDVLVQPDAERLFERLRADLPPGG